MGPGTTAQRRRRRAVSPITSAMRSVQMSSDILDSIVCRALAPSRAARGIGQQIDDGPPQGPDGRHVDAVHTVLPRCRSGCAGESRASGGSSPLGLSNAASGILTLRVGEDCLVLVGAEITVHPERRVAADPPCRANQRMGVPFDGGVIGQIGAEPRLQRIVVHRRVQVGGDVGLHSALRGAGDQEQGCGIGRGSRRVRHRQVGSGSSLQCSQLRRFDARVAPAPNVRVSTADSRLTRDRRGVGPCRP